MQQKCLPTGQVQAATEPAVNLFIPTRRMLTTLCLQGTAISHLLCSFLSVLGGFDPVCTKCFRVLDAGEGNINEMPKQWWLAGLCEEKLFARLNLCQETRPLAFKNIRVYGC